MNTTVRVEGLNETVRALRRVGARTEARAIQTELKKVAAPVVRAGQSKISRYSGASIGTIKPRAAGASVFVTQKAKKVTGKRGDYGLLQQRRLEEALGENKTQVVRGMEAFLDRLGSSEGF